MGTETDDPINVSCHKCQEHTTTPYICASVECIQILCETCRNNHQHQEDILPADQAADATKPFIEKHRKLIRDRLVKVMSKRAKTGFETGTRLDKTAEVKRDIKSWCDQMRQIIDEVENKLIESVETMEQEFEADVGVSMKELRSLEADYKSFNELQSCYSSNNCSDRQQIQLFAIMKKLEKQLFDPDKDLDQKHWEQTYLSFIPDEKCLAQLKAIAYDCGRIKSNIQLSVDTEQDKSSAGLSGMTLIGRRLAVADKFNRCVKTFTCPSRCGLGGEAVDYNVIDKYSDTDDQIFSFTTPVDIAFDKENNHLVLADEQDNCVLAIDADDGRLQWKLETKRPSGVALSEKLVIVCSEYEKYLMTFKRSNNKKASLSLLKDHPLSIAVNKKNDIAMCTLHGKMSIMNLELKVQNEVGATIDGSPFMPQRVSALHNDRFLACDTQRVVEIQSDGAPKRTLLIADMPGTSIPELPRVIGADKHWNIFLGFGKYVKMFPVPMEILPPENGSDANSSGANSATASQSPLVV